MFRRLLQPLSADLLISHSFMLKLEEVIILEVFILASGSKGNMTYLKVGHIRLCIDVGISYRRMRLKMESYDESLESIDALLLTHEHQDHTMGLKMLLKHHQIKHIYLTQGTYNGLKDDVKALIQNYTIIQADQPFMIENIKVTPFMTSHDANEPVAYVIQQDKKVVILNDTGYVDQSYYDLLTDADLYVLEANHHPAMLMNSPRPFLLKKRILSERGHLSNEDAAWLMNTFVKTKKAKWIISHISEDCNTILAIEEAIVQAFDDPTKVDIYYASKEGLPKIVV